MTGFGHQRRRAAHPNTMTTPPVAPESGEPAEVPEPHFVALMRRLGMGTLTFDVPRMGPQGSVPVIEFVSELDAWILSRVDALNEPRLAEQVEARVAERIEAAIEAAVAERTPQIVEDAFQRVRNDLNGDQTPEADDDADDDADLAPQRSRFAAAAEGLIRVSFWSNVEERIVVRYVESLDAELVEWNEDCADPNEDSPLFSADVLIAFGDDVSDERLAVLTGWAHDLLMEDVVAYAGPPNLTTPRLIAEYPEHPEQQSVNAHDGIEAILNMAASDTRPRDTILPPAEPTAATDTTLPGSPGFEPVMVAFWDEDQQKHISDVYGSLEDGDERFQHGEIAFSDADRLVHFGDVPTKDLLALTEWAEGLIEEVTVGISGMPVPGDPRFIDGIQGVIDYMVDRTGDPASNFVPPALSTTTPIPREGIFGDMASVMAELGMPEDMIETLLSEEKQGMDLFAEMAGSGLPDSAVPTTNEGEHNPYPAYTPIEAGPLSTDPFALIMTDPGDWPYNMAYISSDASILHRIEHDQSKPRDEVLQEVCEDMTSIIKTATSEGNWWSQVNKSLDELGIPEERRFEGIFY